MVRAVPKLLGHRVGALVPLRRQARQPRPGEVEHARALPVHQLVVGQELWRGRPTQCGYEGYCAAGDHRIGFSYNFILVSVLFLYQTIKLQIFCQYTGSYNTSYNSQISMTRNCFHYPYAWILMFCTLHSLYCNIKYDIL